MIPIRERMRSRGGEDGCKLCEHALKSIPHCLWNCADAISIWGRSLRIATTCGVNGKVVDPYRSEVNRGRLGGTVKPIGSWIYSIGWRRLPIC